jgi:hypothetical protein
VSDACRVGRVALRAGSRAAVGATASRLETALRLAAWPAGASGEILLVHRLDLGVLAERASVHALADLIGRRLGAVRPARLRPGDPERPDAPAVAFAGRLEALAALAVQLLRHGSARAWYWPRLLPLPAGPPSLADVAGRLLAAAAAPPHGIVGVAGLVRLLVETGAVDRFVAEVPVEVARRFLAAQQIAEAGAAGLRTWSPPPGERAGDGAPGEPAAAVDAASPVSTSWRALPAAWQAAIIRQARALPEADPRLEWLALVAQVAAFGPIAATRPAVRARDLASHARRAVRSGRVAPAAPAERAAMARLRRAPETIPPPEGSGTAGSAGSLEATSESSQVDLVPEGAPVSDWAGLWLLPAALARLRVAEVVSGHGAGLGLAVMRAVAARLGVPADDPALAPLPRPAPEPPPPAPFVAPASWRRLAAPHARASPALALARAGALRLLTDRAGRLPLDWTLDREALRRHARGLPVRRRPDRHAPTGIAIQGVHLALVRDLRRAAGLSLRRLVRRRGAIAATATHVDVTFPGEVIELPLRHAGLDLDPGWVPWLGRVVAYHYDLEARLRR